MSVCKHCGQEYLPCDDAEYSKEGYCSKQCHDMEKVIFPLGKPEQWDDELKGERIHELEQLERARQEKKSVITSWHAFSHRPHPAAFIINMSGYQLLQIFQRGCWIYRKEYKKL